MLVEAAWGASEEWLDTIANLFDFRWIVDVGRVVGIYCDAPHYDFELLDKLSDALKALPFKTGGGGLPKHRALKKGDVILRHGAYFSREALRQFGDDEGADEDDGQDAAGHEGAGAAVDYKVDIVWHMKPTAEDVTALLSSNKLGDPNELTRFAKTRGLLFGDGHAEKFLAGIATNEAMLLELARHKFPELHARLRVPITGHDQSGATVTALPPESKTAPLADMSAPMSVTGHGTTMARSSPVPSVVAAAAVHVRGTGGGGGGNSGGGGGQGGASGQTGAKRAYRGPRVAMDLVKTAQADEYNAAKREIRLKRKREKAITKAKGLLEGAE